MDIRITGGPKGGTVKAIPSKSAAHRILIAAALSGQDLAPYCEGLSRDITATKQCLQRMLPVAGRRNEEEPVELPCGESGSTLRFLIPLAGVLGIDAGFLCEGRLPDRPMEPFLRALSACGCQVEGRNPKRLHGRLQGGTFLLPGDISSQYVTGLLMAMPLAEDGSTIIVEGTLQSRPYIDLTLEILAKAGIQVKETGEENRTVFAVPGRQSYQLPPEELEQIEGDWSNGAFWIVMDRMLRRNAEEDPASAARDERNEDDGREMIRCVGLDPHSRQGDKAILTVMKQMQSADSLLRKSRPDCPRTAGSRHGGCRSVVSASDPSGMDISPVGRSGFVEIDASDIPDLVPIIAAFACGRPKGALTHIAKAGRLRLKESDRLRSVTETLQALGGDIAEEPDGLMIRGSGFLTGGEVSSFGDHRIVMMAAAAACITEGEILIRGAEAVSKSYPGFFEEYRKLGGQWKEIEKE